MADGTYISTTDHRPFETVMTIRLRAKVDAAADEPQHFKTYSEIVQYLRALRQQGWKLESIETIDRDQE